LLPTTGPISQKLFLVVVVFEVETEADAETQDGFLGWVRKWDLWPKLPLLGCIQQNNLLEEFLQIGESLAPKNEY